MSKKTDNYLKKQDRADAVLFIIAVMAIIFCTSCRKTRKVECWTCTHADGRPLPLAPCQPKPVVIYNADGTVLPVKCTVK